MEVKHVPGGWWKKFLDRITEPPDTLLLAIDPDWLPNIYCYIDFFKPLRAIPQVIQLNFETWDELTGFLYDHGFVVEDPIIIDDTQFYYCRTFAGKLAGYASDQPMALLDSRLEIINN